MNEYAQISDFKSYFGISTDDRWDNLIKDWLTWASRQMDRFTGRFFFEKTETRKFDCPESGRDLMFDWPLLALTTLTNGNGSTISSSYYKLYPDPNNPPFLWLELDKSSGIAWEYSTTPQQAIQVLGQWGWHEEYSEAWEDSGETVQDDPLADDGTTLTPSGVAIFDDQQMLKIGSEQIYVSSAGTSTLTIARGKNGTTAAAHAQNAAIYIYRPQYDIIGIALRLAYWRYKQKDAAFEKTGHPSLGIVTVPAALPMDIQKDLLRFRKV